MSALEVKRLSHGRGLCEMCLAEKGPTRSALYAVFLCGHPVACYCQVHQARWKELFGQEKP